MAIRTSANHLASGTTPGTAPWWRQRLLVTGAILAVATSITVTVLLTGGGHPVRNAEPAALPATSMATALTVDGQAIPVRQLMLQVQADRAATFAYFQRRFGAGDSARFWHTRFDKTTPAGYLIGHAIADTVTLAVERRLAQQHGLLADPGYAAFLQSWTAENARRAAAIAKHQVIFGPTQYSEAGYFTYLMADLVPRLENALLADGTISVTEADAKAYYAAHPEQFPVTTSYQAVAAQAKQRLLDQTFKAYLASAAAQAKVVRATDVLSRIPVN